MKYIGCAILALITGSLATCLYRPEQTASVALSDGVSFTLALRPMLGLNSDRQRRLVLADASQRMVVDLSADTGWWRGSTLYLHPSGTILLHDGQDGCYGFLPPLRRGTAVERSCISEAGLAWLEQAQETYRGYPASRYYPGFFYIGHFSETGTRGNRAVFTGFDVLPEPELPNPL